MGRTTRIIIPKPERPVLEQPTNLSRAIIIDLDGTVALNTHGRPFYGKGAAEAMHLDKEWTASTKFIREYCETFDCFLIVVTGRPGTPEMVEATKKWLDDHWLTPTEIYFRNPNDYRKGDIVKAEIFNNHLKGRFQFDFVLEDSHKCVLAWRNLGLLCFQVWDCD